jgi:hypothetical protein
MRCPDSAVSHAARILRVLLGGWIVVCAAQALTAQAGPAGSPAVAPGKVSTAAPEWRELIGKFASRSDAVADFEERRYFPFRKDPVVLKGEVRVSARHGLSLAYAEPERRIVIIDDKGVLLREPSGEKLPPADPRASAANDAMLHILRMDFAALEKSFEIDGAHSADEWTLTLVPRAEAVRRSIGTIHVAGDMTSVRQIELRRSPKQHIDIVIAAPRAPAAFSADEMKRFFR